jgi:hypothetical protein
MPNTRDQSEQQYDSNAPRARENNGQSNPEGEPSAGVKDKEATTSDSYGHTRESGEQPKKG